MHCRHTEWCRWILEKQKRKNDSYDNFFTRKITYQRANKDDLDDPPVNTIQGQFKSPDVWDINEMTDEFFKKLKNKYSGDICLDQLIYVKRKASGSWITPHAFSYQAFREIKGYPPNVTNSAYPNSDEQLIYLMKCLLILKDYLNDINLLDLNSLQEGSQKKRDLLIKIAEIVTPNRFMDIAKDKADIENTKKQIDSRRGKSKPDFIKKEEQKLQNKINALDQNINGALEITKNFLTK